MKKSERCIVYTALVLLSALNAVFLLSSSGRSAFAEASAWLADLGPADSVKLVDGEQEIAVRNKAGRLAWGDGDFKQTYTVAFVDISRALNPLMESQAFIDEREALRKEFEGAEGDYRTRLQAMDEELKAMDQQAPEFRDKVQAFQTLYQEYMRWREQEMAKHSELDVKHLQQAYREMSSAVNVVADKLGVDIVLRFIPTDKDFKAVDAEQALNEIRLRAAVRYPEKLDITSEVLEELSLQDTDR